MRAILFDFDGVIALSEDLYWKSANSLLEPRGVRVPREEWFARFPGTGVRHIFSSLLREHGLGGPHDVPAWIARWKAAYQALIRAEGVKPVPGLHAFLKLLDARGIPRAICTGTPRANVLLQLEILGLSFPLVAAEDYVHHKPHPEGYLKAAALLKQAPQDCVVFEDAPPGLQAAKAAGMRCVAFLTTVPRARLEREKPDLLVKDFTELNLDKVLAL
ncbi:MAG: HAD family phosphatase [Candidatus Aenigmarchaeota archaeon]|nr:HAD family phosphatase [Candidatus Aenigmarchaeota archaeon]